MEGKKDQPKLQSPALNETDQRTDLRPGRSGRPSDQCGRNI